MNDAPQGTAGTAGEPLSPPVETAPPEPVTPSSAAAEGQKSVRPSQLPDSGDRPTFVFFGIVAAVSLIADVASKAWAEIVLSQRTMGDPSIVIIKDHLSFTLAYNKGGAWGLLQDASEVVRRPFFLAVSVLAILFIVSLYGKLQPGQRALKWGLPLVLGGALGNLSDRITRSSVIDFIDYRADWVAAMNRLIAGGSKTWGVTDHWPTFNVADIAICIGVALMGVDMFTSRRTAPRPEAAPALVGGSASGNTVPPGSSA
jgi:signal peptidase II